MARSLVALRVEIGLKPNGEADYPAFNTLASVQASGKDWAKYVDTDGDGWLYDAVGHREEDAGNGADLPASPFGMQWGVLLVPLAFANEAVAAFPTKCTKLTEAELETFFDQRIARDEPDEEIDEEVLHKIKAKDDLGIPRTREDEEALHRTHPRRGVTENHRKTLARFKAKKGITIDES